MLNAFEPRGQFDAGHRLARDHQDGVVAGDGADHVRQRRAVDRAGQVVRGTRRRAQHREVAAGVGGHQQFAQQPRHPFGAAGNAAHRAAVLGDDVDADAAVGAAQLDRTEFLEVARQRGLGDVDALVGQHRGQLALAAHRLRRQDRHDAGLPTGPGRVLISGCVITDPLQQPHQQRLLRVQPVLGLVPHRAVRAVDHLVGDLVAAVRRKAVQHNGIRLSPRRAARR